VRAVTWELYVVHERTYVYPIGNMGITRWVEPWGARLILIYTISSLQLMEEVRWQNITEVAEECFRNHTNEQEATE